MSDDFVIRPIARLQSDLKEKFGVPRQAGIVEALEGRIVFEPEYRNRTRCAALRAFPTSG